VNAAMNKAATVAADRRLGRCEKRPPSRFAFPSDLPSRPRRKTADIGPEMTISIFSYGIRISNMCQ
jgi:hypothetical protein